MGGWELVGHWRLPYRYRHFHLVHEDSDGLPSKFRRKAIPNIWYFMVNSGAVFFLPFLSIYWRQSLGFTTQQIGLIQALRPWVSAAAGNILAPLCDAWGCHYLILLITYSLTMTFRGLMTMEWGFGPMLALALLMETVLNPMGIIVDATIVAGSTKDGTYGRARLWASVGWGVCAPIAGAVLGKWGIHTCFMIFVVIYSLAAIPTLLVPAWLLSRKQQEGSLPTTIPQEQLTSEKKPAAAALPVSFDATSAPAQPGEGVLKAAAAAPNASIVTSRTSRRSSKQDENQAPAAVHLNADLCGSVQEAVVLDLHAAFSPAAAAQVSPPMAVPLAPRRPSATPLPTSDIPHVLATIQVATQGETAVAAAKEGDAAVKKAAGAPAAPAAEESIKDALKRLFSDIYVLTFMFLAFIMGVGNGFVGYLFLLLSDLGGTRTVLGLCLAMNCIGEIPIFYYSGAIVKKIGVAASINIGMAAYVLRLLCYALLPRMGTTWVVLPIELLQGLTFALAYSAGTVHCKRISPKNVRSTVQGIYSGLYTGFGAGVGGLAGGLLYGQYGGEVMYYAATAIVAGGWALAYGTNLVNYARLALHDGVGAVRNFGNAVYRTSMARLSPGMPQGTASSTDSLSTLY